MKINSVAIAYNNYNTLVLQIQGGTLCAERSAADVLQSLQRDLRCILRDDANHSDAKTMLELVMAEQRLQATLAYKL